MRAAVPLPTPVAQDLVLVGGGHAHVHVLQRFGRQPMPGVRLTLIAGDVETPYSPMLAGYVAGHYRFAECHVDLVRLARFAGARLVHDEAVGLDRARREVHCRAHPPIRYDVVSLDVGSAPRRAEIPGMSRLVAVEPNGRFAQRWDALLGRVGSLHSLRLALVGAGAGGVELALAAQHRLTRLLPEPPEMTLVCGDGLLPSHNGRMRKLVSRRLAQRGIAVIAGRPVVRVEPGRLLLGDAAAPGGAVAFDEALWAAEAPAAPWLAETGLALDAAGFVATDRHLRAGDDPAVFAAGGIAATGGDPHESAGAAMRAGPPLALNLRHALAERPPRRTVQRRRGPTMIGTGDARAIAAHGVLAGEAGWLWRLKQRLDRRRMRGFAELPELPADDAAALRCGGCAAKVPADVLGRVIERLAASPHERVPVGIGDDAAVVALPGAPPMLQTVDFFRAMVADPYLFGRIAATHALGDIYAMGGVPETALAIAALPPARPAISEHDLFHMLKGGTDVLEAAGATLVGGHSAEAAEPALGFAVTGRSQPGHVLRKSGLKPGDRLILTKPLGTGAILAAEMRNRTSGRVVAAALETMLQSAAASSWILASSGATACTDVTGFGLLGHLLEMLRASAVDARLDPQAVPALDGALDLLAAGIATSLHAANLASFAALDGADPAAPLAALLIDPQTAGGLLAGVPAGRAEDCLGELRDIGYRAAEIGVVVAMAGAAPRVRLEPGSLARPAVAIAAK